MESSKNIIASAVPPLPRIKRSIFIVKKGLQAKFVFLVMVSVVVAVGMMGWDFYHTFGRDIVRDLMDPGLFELFQKIGYVLIVKLAIYLAAVALVAVYLSHKLAGPIYRFELSSRIVAGGDLTHRVRLRKGDELVELQDEFNGMVEALHERVSKDANLAQRISKQLNDLIEHNHIAPDALQRLREIKAEVDHLTAGFKV